MQALDVAPTATVMLAGMPVSLHVDCRAACVLERATGLHKGQVVQQYLDSRQEEPLNLLIWALSSRHRAKNRLRFERDDQDEDLKTIVPLSFLELLPSGSQRFELEKVVLELLKEAGWIMPKRASSSESEGDDDVDPLAASPDPATGAEESLTPSPLQD